MKTKSHFQSAAFVARTSVAIGLSLIIVSATGCASGGGRAETQRATGVVAWKDVQLLKSAPSSYTWLGRVWSESYPKGNGLFLRYAEKDLRKAAAERGANGLLFVEVLEEASVSNPQKVPSPDAGIYREDFITTRGYAQPYGQPVATGPVLPVRNRTRQLCAVAVIVPLAERSNSEAATWAKLPSLESTDWVISPNSGMKELKSTIPATPASD